MAESMQTNSPVLMERVASGQRLIIYAILINFLAVALRTVAGQISVLADIAGIVISLVGLFRLATGMGYSKTARIFLAVLAIVPLANLISLLVLNSRATKALRGAGYKVGLLGASGQPANPV